MVTHEPNPHLVAEFSDSDALPTPWAEVVELLESSEMFWLSSVRADGRPHVVPLPAMWHHGALHFCTGPLEQKAKNLARNSAVTLATGVNSYRDGLVVTVEGAAERVTDDPTLAQLAQLWLDKIQWPFEVRDGRFVDIDAGGAPVLVFAVVPTKILAFGKAPYSQTRYRMPNLRIQAADRRE